MTTTEFDELEFFGAMDNPYGITRGEWITIWWDWILPVHTEKSPPYEEVGPLWNINQALSDVYFLTGNFATEDSKDKKFPRE